MERTALLLDCGLASGADAATVAFGKVISYTMWGKESIDWNSFLLSQG